jgi:hypothetical protein
MNERTTGGLMTGTELEDYVAAVTARLGAIPDRDETLEELRSHLEEVRAEHTGVALRDVLGEPAAYADELRAAAGLPPYEPQRAGAAAWFAARAAGARRHAPHLLMDLRAFWWGVRGLALGVFVYALIPAVRQAFEYNEYAGMWSHWLSPDEVFSVVATTLGSAPATTVLVLLVVMGVVLSIWLGGALARGVGPRWVSTVVGALGVLLGVWFLNLLWVLLTSGVSERLGQLLNDGSWPGPPF